MNDAILSLQNVSKRFGDRRVLDGVSLSVGAGELVALTHLTAPENVIEAPLHVLKMGRADGGLARGPGSRLSQSGPAFPRQT
jgi:ABC-type histidine transport system ATPase subunit